MYPIASARLWSSLGSACLTCYLWQGLVQPNNQVLVFRKGDSQPQFVVRVPACQAPGCCLLFDGLHCKSICCISRPPQPCLDAGLQAFQSLQTTTQCCSPLFVLQSLYIVVQLYTPCLNMMQTAKAGMNTSGTKTVATQQSSTTITTMI